MIQSFVKWFLPFLLQIDWDSILMSTEVAHRRNVSFHLVFQSCTLSPLQRRHKFHKITGIFFPICWQGRLLMRVLLFIGYICVFVEMNYNPWNWHCEINNQVTLDHQNTNFHDRSQLLCLLYFRYIQSDTAMLLPNVVLKCDLFIIFAPGHFY